MCLRIASFKKSTLKEDLFCVCIEAVKYLNQAVLMFKEIGRLSMAAKYYKVCKLISSALLLHMQIWVYEVDIVVGFVPQISQFTIAMFLRFTFSFQEIAEIYEKEDNIAESMEFYENAAELYEGEEATSQGNQCKLKVAQFAAILEQYVSPS